MARRIDRYELEQVLGKGGMGTVYAARDVKLNRRVAIKVLDPENDDPKLRRRFQMEARAIATLRHPNIVKLFDYSDEDSPELYLVMEYVPGSPLSALLDEFGPVTEQTALSVGHELAVALVHAHSEKVVHRDIKPANVILHEGRLVLLDFGAMKVFDTQEALGVERAVETTQAMGTPGFMAPEQFIGRDIDPRTDIFALGALLYNMTTDALPYHGTDVDDIEELYAVTQRGEYRDPRNYQPLLTPGFCDLLRDCLASRRAGRIAEMSRVQARIARLLEGHGISDVQEELRTYERDPRRSETTQGARTVDALIQELKSALLRELQSAIKQKNSRRARKAMTRLRNIAPMDSQPVGAGRSNLLGWLLSPRARSMFWLFAGLATGISFTHFLYAAYPYFLR